MNRKLWEVFAGVCLLAMSALSFAQMAEMKEKPPMYSYVSFWALPRAQWAGVSKAHAADQKVLDQALNSGGIVGYGDDEILVHQADGITHDDWWSSMSMAGLINVLDQFYKSGSTTSPVLASATKHWDGIFVSRNYSWRPGTYKGVFTHGASYKLKADAPEDAVEKLSKHLFVPLLDKLIADGTLLEYEIDTEAIHTEAPGTFWIFYLTGNPEGLDKVNAAVREAMKSNPLGGPAFDNMVDFSAHRDYLAKTNATYK
jgi:hypothetical protein